MDKSIIDRYKSEMLKMHRRRSTEFDTAKTETAVPTIAPTVEAAKQNEIPDTKEARSDGTGYLVGIVSALRSLYPVENAAVTVFTGSYDDMQAIAASVTDKSGRTAPFALSAPSASASQSAGAEAEPYSKYNMLVRAEGYVDNIHLNIPIFSGVTSLQRSDMLLLEAADENKSPQIFDEDERYNL